VVQSWGGDLERGGFAKLSVVVVFFFGLGFTNFSMV
jgi:hypothetical protein